MAAAVLAGVSLVPPVANAASTCGVSDGNTLCVTVPDGSLTGEAPIHVTYATNKGTVIATWLPSTGPAVGLITKAKPSPETGDYSFVWPTHKYLDGSGVLRVQHGSTSSTPVDVDVTLSNGNVTDFQHSPNDWSNYLPGPWTRSTDPVVAAVGDAAADEPVPNATAASIIATDPAMFLYLGDVYEDDTFTENLNHYGRSALDGTPGTLWGALAAKTQPTVGNHDSPHLVDWKDYWHGHPDITSFTFGGVMFLDLNSNKSMLATSAQYRFVQNALATAPPCVVAFWHIPTLAKGSVSTNSAPLWDLLADNGADLVVNGHAHLMAEYQPLDGALQPGGHLVELISGAGGHALNAADSDPQGRVKWSVGNVAGALYLTLNGAANGGTASGIGWSFQDVNHNVLETGSVACGATSPPTASFTASPTTGPAPLTVSFTDTTSGGAPVTDWAWEFGDGSTSTEQNPTHTFATAGTYTVSLTVSSTAGSSTATRDISVTPAVTSLTVPPTADAYVKSNYPKANYGGETSIKGKLKSATEEFRPYVSFSVQGLSTAPASAKLRLYVTDGSDSGGTWYATSPTWDESTITWNNAPALLDANALTDIGAVRSGAWIEIDVTNVVTGNGSYSFGMKTLSPDIVAFSSKEGANAPQLVITLPGG